MLDWGVEPKGLAPFPNPLEQFSKIKKKGQPKASCSSPFRLIGWVGGFAMPHQIAARVWERSGNMRIVI